MSGRLIKRTLRGSPDGPPVEVVDAPFDGLLDHTGWQTITGADTESAYRETGPAERNPLREVVRHRRDSTRPILLLGRKEFL